MRAQILRLGAIAILITLCSQWVAPETGNDSLPFDIDEWLRYTKRKDFSWSVNVAKPSLTFQQRFLVTVNVSIDCNRLPSSEKDYDLHFVMKVAAGDNAWTPGYSHTRLTVPLRLDKSHAVNFVDGVYLRPGRYTLALIVYDSVTGKGNVLRKEIKVPRPKLDELPELDRTLNDVEFTTEVPQPSRSGRSYAPWYERSYAPRMYVLSYQPLAAGREWLPVKNRRRICLDIVANISPGGTFANVKEFGRGYANPFNVLQVASILSHLGLENGSIHVSILDTLGVKTYFYHENAINFDWQRTGQALLKQGGPDTVDYGELMAQTEASAYLLDTLHKIVDEGSCTPDSQLPLKIVLVVSGGLKFAERTPIRPLVPPDLQQNPAPVKVFYFHIGAYSGDLDKMLEPVKPQKFNFNDALSFRRALAEFIFRLEEM